MKTLLTTLGVTFALAAGPCFAADSFTPEGDPVYSVTAKGKDGEAAGGNARVAALRSAMKEMAGDDFVKAHSKEVRNGIILRYKDFTRDPQNASTEKDGKLMRMTADVAVDARSLAAALSGLGAEVSVPEPPAGAADAPADTGNAGAADAGASDISGAGTEQGAENSGEGGASGAAVLAAAGTDGLTAQPAAAEDGGLSWLSSSGLTWKERTEGDDGSIVLAGVAASGSEKGTDVKVEAERLLLRNAAPGEAAGDPVTVEFARFEGLRITAETEKDVTVVRAPFLEVRSCRLVLSAVGGKTSFLPESSVAKGSPEMRMADITAEVRAKGSPDAKPAVITIKSASTEVGDAGQGGSLTGVSVDDGDGVIVTLDEFGWSGLLIPSAPEIASIAADGEALGKAAAESASAAAHGGSVELKGLRGSFGDIVLKLGTLSFALSPAGAEGSSFRFAAGGLEVPPALIDMIPDIPADTVKAVLPEGEILGFSLEGRIVPGRTSGASSTLKAVLTGANLCDISAETEFLLDAGSFAELSEGGAGMAALMGAAGRISVKKASAALADRKALGLMLAVGSTFMESTPSKFLPQLSAILQSVKPAEPKNGTDKILADLIGAVQPVLATLGGVGISLEFPTPLKLAAPDIPDDVMVSTSVTESPKPVLESLPENLR